MVNNVSSVVKDKLCLSCGTCYAVCPASCISISSEKPFPNIDESKCINCKKCLQVCPGIGVNFKKYNKKVFGKSDEPVMGHYIEAFYGHSNDKKIRSISSSGGFVTALLIYALENKIIDKAIVVRQNKSKPWLSEGFIAKSKNEIINAAQSKYQVLPINCLLKKVKSSREKFAIVALPCELHGISKIEDNEITSKLILKIGLYCHLNSSIDCISFLVKKYGGNYKNVKSVEYRAGSWPGGFRITLKNNKSYFIDKFSYNFVHMLFVPERCKTCVDLCADFSDISVGDAWIPELMNNKKGYSLALVRTKRGKSIFDNAIKKGNLTAWKISNPYLAHKHTIDDKKQAGFARIAIFKLLGRKVPNYGFKNNFSVRQLFSSFMFLTINFISTISLMRLILRFVPIKILSFPVVLLRKIRTTNKAKVD